MDSSKARHDSGMCEMESSSPEKALQKEDIKVPMAPSDDGLQEQQPAAVGLPSSAAGSAEWLGFKNEEEWHRKIKELEFEASEDMSTLGRRFNDFEESHLRSKLILRQKGLALRQKLAEDKMNFGFKFIRKTESERRTEFKRLRATERAIKKFQRDFKDYESTTIQNQDQFWDEYKELLGMNRELFQSTPGSPEASEPHESDGHVQL